MLAVTLKPYPWIQLIIVKLQEYFMFSKEDKNKIEKKNKQKNYNKTKQNIKNDKPFQV